MTKRSWLRQGASPGPWGRESSRSAAHASTLPPAPVICRYYSYTLENLCESAERRQQLYWTWTGLFCRLPWCIRDQHSGGEIWHKSSQKGWESVYPQVLCSRPSWRKAPTKGNAWSALPGVFCKADKEESRGGCRWWVQVLQHESTFRIIKSFCKTLIWFNPA